MGKVDWRGISMAIGQVNQLLEPSYKQKKEMELEDWKTKEIWSQGFEELTKLDNEIDKSWDELGVKTEEIANIDLSLSSKVPERDLTNGGLFINQALGMKTLDGMRQVISDGNKKLEEVQNYIKEGTSTIASYKSGNELLQNIPLTYDENSKLPAHLKGLADFDEDGEITGYSNFDSDNDGSLSTKELSAAKTQVINMLSVRDDLSHTFNPEAFEVGFNSALDEQKLLESQVQRDRAGEEYKYWEKKRDKVYGDWKIEKDANERETNERKRKLLEGRLKPENFSAEDTIKSIFTLENMMLEDRTLYGENADNAKYYHEEDERKEATPEQVASTDAIKERLQKLYSRAFELNIKDFGLPTLQRLVSATPGSGASAWDYGDDETFIYGETTDTDGIGQINWDEDNLENIMAGENVGGELKSYRKQAMANLISNSINIEPASKKQILHIIDLYQEFDEHPNTDKKDKMAYGALLKAIVDKAATGNIDTEYNILKDRMLNPEKY
jgi:hypothetical protein